MRLTLIATAGLAIGLWAALSFFWGSMDQQSYRNWLLGGTLVWFAFATMGSRGAR